MACACLDFADVIAFCFNLGFEGRNVSSKNLHVLVVVVGLLLEMRLALCELVDHALLLHKFIE